jgi:hypothetical protein
LKAENVALLYCRRAATREENQDMALMKFEGGNFARKSPLAVLTLWTSLDQARGEG